MDQGAVRTAKQITIMSADDNHGLSGVQCSLQQETHPETDATASFEVAVPKGMLQLHQINTRGNCDKITNRNYYADKPSAKWLADAKRIQTL